MIVEDKMIEETEFLKSEENKHKGMSSFLYSITQLGINVLKQNGLVEVDK